MMCLLNVLPDVLFGSGREAASKAAEGFKDLSRRWSELFSMQRNRP